MNGVDMGSNENSSPNSLWTKASSTLTTGALADCGVADAAGRLCERPHSKERKPPRPQKRGHHEIRHALL